MPFVTQTPSIFAGRSLVIATMHGKEKVIQPILEESLDVRCVVPAQLNTDRFGTFSGEVAREGSPVEAARRKVMAAIELTGAELGIASEGSFDSHPTIPFVRADVELILLIDVRNGLEVYTQEISLRTNFDRKVCLSWEEIEQFAQTAGFPAHALILYEGTDPNGGKIIKGIQDPDWLRNCANEILGRAEKITVETDMRAHYNPTRMQVIEKATLLLIQKLTALCPQCGWPNFTVKKRISGLPCSWCTMPTRLPIASVSQCERCGFQLEQRHPDGVTASDPAYCDYCNP